MSEKADRKDEEMTDMRKAFDTNRSETISLSRKFKEKFEVQEAEHKNILTRKQIKFDLLIHNFQNKMQGCTGTLVYPGEAVRFSGQGQNAIAPEDSFPQGTAHTKDSRSASLRTVRADITEEMKDLLGTQPFMRNVLLRVRTSP